MEFPHLSDVGKSVKLYMHYCLITGVQTIQYWVQKLK